MSSQRNDSEASSKDPTLFDLIHNVKSGQLTTGPRKPLPWLEYASREKTAQERKIEGVMESCTFKALMSCVVGMCRNLYVTLGRLCSVWICLSKSNANYYNEGY